MAERNSRELQEIEGLGDLPKPIAVDVGDNDDDGADGKSAAGKEAARSVDTDRKTPAKEDENVAALRRDLEAANRRTREAEARARDLEAKRQAAEAQTAEGQLRLINTSLQSAEEGFRHAKNAYRAALEKGDHDATVAAQADMNEAQYRVSSLREGKERAEQKAEGERRAREERGREVRIPDDPVEAMIVTSGLSSRSADWLRTNPDCVTDKRKNAQMVRAHHAAQGEGIDVDSPEYFAFIEKRLGIGHDDDVEDQLDPRPVPRQQQRRPAATDAPVSRGASGDGRGSGSRTVTLSPQQRQFCDDSGIKYEEYARQLINLKSEGRLQ